ncbi:MAG: hypothetical protein QOE23_1392 [Pseudonocardiales bacterium]|nr:hypothetical protein [Pseudonocardiales bacterium]
MIRTTKPATAVSNLCRAGQLRSSTHSFQPSGAGPQAGSGVQPGFGSKPGGGAGQFGGELKRLPMRNSLPQWSACIFSHDFTPGNTFLTLLPGRDSHAVYIGGCRGHPVRTVHSIGKRGSSSRYSRRRQPRRTTEADPEIGSASVGRSGAGTGCSHAAFLVSQKMVSISAIMSSSFWPSAGSTELLPPAAPACLVALLNSSCSCGYFSKCGGLK